jgi:hypothetical protein
LKDLLKDCRAIGLFFLFIKFQLAKLVENCKIQILKKKTRFWIGRHFEISTK